MAFDYINEAFKRLSVLDEEMFNTTSDGINHLADFIDSDDETIRVIDKDATESEDLKDSYIGKVIVNCNVCHSHIFENKEDITIDEEGVVNAEEACPYCGEQQGFVIVGEIAPFDNEPEVEVDGESVEIDSDDETEADEVQEESLTEGIFDSKAKKEQKYEELIQKIFKKSSSQIFHLIKDHVESAYKAALNNKYIIDESDDKFEVRRMIKQMERALASEDNTPTAFKTLLTQLHGDESANERILSEFDEIKSGLSRLGAADKIGLKAQGYLCEKINVVLKRFLSSVIKDFRGDHQLKESANHSIASTRAISEDFKEVSIKTDDQHLAMSSDDNGKISVTSEPIEASDITDSSFEEESIAPLSDETSEEILANNEISEEEPIEETDMSIEAEEAAEEEPAEEISDEESSEEDLFEESFDTHQDVDFEEIDEDTINNLTESYFKRVYENVESFTTTDVKCTPTQMIIEGTIRFASGTQRHTGFIFEAKDVNARGQLRFNGTNKHLTEATDAFTLLGRVDNKKLFVESLKYNYTTNESVVRGRVYRK